MVITSFPEEGHFDTLVLSAVKVAVIYPVSVLTSWQIPFTGSELCVCSSCASFSPRNHSFLA